MINGFKVAGKAVKNGATRVGEATKILPAARIAGRFLVSPWGQGAILVADGVSLGFNVASATRHSVDAAGDLTGAVRAGENAGDLSGDLSGAVRAGENVPEDLPGAVRAAGVEEGPIIKQINRAYREKDGNVIILEEGVAVNEITREAMKRTRISVAELSGMFKKVLHLKVIIMNFCCCCYRNKIRTAFPRALPRQESRVWKCWYQLQQVDQSPTGNVWIEVWKGPPQRYHRCG